MGSGKSSVGKKLASEANMPFIDLDRYIETKENATITELFQKKGELYFRKKERLYLEELMQRQEAMVLATGGGTPCYGTTMEFLKSQKNAHTVYLQCTPQLLTERLFTEKDKRPLVAHLPTKEALNEFIRKHVFERAFYYNQASFKIHVGKKEMDEIVREIQIALV